MSGFCFRSECKLHMVMSSDNSFYMTCYFPTLNQVLLNQSERTQWYTSQHVKNFLKQKSQRCSFASCSSDHDTGTQLSLQRTRHVNTTSIAGLSDTVWPIGQLPVNKISVFYHPVLPFPDHTPPLHLQIMTAGQCIHVGESEPVGPSCYFSLSLTFHVIQAVLSVSLSS